MSITFSIGANFTDEHGSYTGSACKGHGDAPYSCTEPEHLLDPYTEICGCDCKHEAREAAIEACAVCSLDLNVSNHNAQLILERLGVEFDYAGSIDPTDLLGRALVANVGRDDSGTDAAEYGEPGKARMIDCGLRPGYFADRFGALADLASAAAARGALITWS